MIVEVGLPEELGERLKLAAAARQETHCDLIVRALEMLLAAEAMPGGYQVVAAPGATCGCGALSTRWLPEAGALVQVCGSCEGLGPDDWARTVDGGEDAP